MLLYFRIAIRWEFCQGSTGLFNVQQRWVPTPHSRTSPCVAFTKGATPNARHLSSADEQRMLFVRTFYTPLLFMTIPIVKNYPAVKCRKNYHSYIDIICDVMIMNARKLIHGPFYSTRISCHMRDLYFKSHFNGRQPLFLIMCWSNWNIRKKRSKTKWFWLFSIPPMRGTYLNNGVHYTSCFKKSLKFHEHAIGRQ